MASTMRENISRFCCTVSLFSLSANCPLLFHMSYAWASQFPKLICAPAAAFASTAAWDTDGRLLSSTATPASMYSPLSPAARRDVGLPESSTNNSRTAVQVERRISTLRTQQCPAESTSSGPLP